MLYRIPEQNMEALEKALSKFEKKCEKFGNEFSFKIEREEFEKMPDDKGGSFIQKYFIIELEGKAIINGWQMIAVIDHTTKGNLVYRQCDVEVPERYRNIGPCCEHCNTNRYRKETFLLFNEEKQEYKLVGRTCLKDFLGVDASYFAYRYEFTKEVEESTKGIYTVGHKQYFNVEEFLCIVEECIRIFGFVSRTKASYDDIESTSDKVKRLINSVYTDAERDVLLKKEYDPFCQENIDTVNAAIKAITSYDGESNDYIENLKCLAKAGYVEIKHFGFLASLMSWYHKGIEKAERQKRYEEAQKIKMKSEHVGTIGGKVSLHDTNVRKMTSFEGKYGVTNVYEIMDRNGNVFTWFTSKDIDEGTYNVYGTVKEHKVYNDIKQTVLTRCKLA